MPRRTICPRWLVLSPFNGVWFLGIILLNLLIGRNPWKLASLGDSTRFLPTTSDEVNALLARVLDVDRRRHLTVVGNVGTRDG